MPVTISDFQPLESLIEREIIPCFSGPSPFDQLVESHTKLTVKINYKRTHTRQRWISRNTPLVHYMINLRANHPESFLGAYKSMWDSHILYYWVYEYYDNPLTRHLIKRDIIEKFRNAQHQNIVRPEKGNRTYCIDGKYYDHDPNQEQELDELPF